MKSLFTSSGIGNPSISDVLVDLLGKPIAESTPALVMSTQHRRPAPSACGGRRHNAPRTPPAGEGRAGGRAFPLRERSVTVAR
jgi:dipeptidase E